MTGKGHFTFAALLSCFINVLQLTFSFYMFVIYGNVCVSNSMNSLKTFTVAATYALIILGFFTYIRALLLTTAGNDLNSRFRNKVFMGMLGSHAGLQKQASPANAERPWNGKKFFYKSRHFSTFLMRPGLRFTLA